MTKVPLENARGIVPGILCLLLLTTAVPAARADVLFSNLGPGNSFNPTTANGGSPGYDLAIGFTASGTGTFTLTSLELPIAHFDEPTSTATFLLATFQIGGPGATLGTLGTFTGFSAIAPGNPLSVFNVLGAGVTLTGGTNYYLVVDATPSSVVVVYQNSISQLGGVGRSGDAAPWMTTGTATSFAVRINGTSVSAAAPEPGTAALLFSVSGCLGIALLRRRHPA